ncbi:hypothetical protein [Cohnella yongneupensis]|uniref:Uncharacterized protein n=1 Tax=Cohnella yongneupensis TaxID=425006 RepID=A0ABW0R9T9_9BACL
MEKKPIASKVMHLAKQVPAAVQQVVTHPIAKQPTAVMPAAQAPSKALCLSHMHRYVEVQAADGYCYDGIVEHVDDQWLCLAVPGAVDPMRGFFPPPPFYPPYAPFRPRRFERLALPLAGLVALSLLPYYW